MVFGGTRTGRDANATGGAGADGIMKERGAVDAAAHCDVVFFVEFDHDIISTDAFDIEEDDGCATLGCG